MVDRVKHGPATATEPQPSGQVYDDTVAWVHETKPDTDPKAAVVLRVSSVYVCHSGPDQGNDVVLP